MSDYRTNNFAKPRGLFGKYAGYLMSYGSENRFRLKWALQQMNIKKDDSILEIGFGAGLSLSMLCEAVSKGCVYGLEESSVMVKSALRKNKKMIKNGKLKIFHSSVDNLPKFDRIFEKILTINSFEFWEEKIEALSKLKDVMPRNAEVFIVHKIYNKMSDLGIDDLSQEYCGYLKKAGFGGINSSTDNNHKMICVRGMKQ